MEADVTYSEVGIQRSEVSSLGEQSALVPRSFNAGCVDNGHILVVDDQQEICDLVREYLTEEGFRVSIANDSAGLSNEMARSKIDLVILDLMLGGEDGLRLARELRDSRPEIGILILTGRRETVDRIIGLEMGADDYLSKPFHLRELLARVRSILRRATSRGTEKSDTRHCARFDDWVLDLSSRQLLSPSAKAVRLTTGEFELLAVLVNHANQVLSRDRLLDLSRHREAGPFDRTIDVQVGRLRCKLKDDPKNPTIIKTVRGGGYMFIPAVEFE
jgi:two-component system OmpR family response regulator